MRIINRIEGARTGRIVEIFRESIIYYCAGGKYDFMPGGFGRAD